MYWICGTISCCSSLAGTLLQLLGVYRNCVCRAGLIYLTRKGGAVEFATDTKEARDKAWISIMAGVLGLVILLLVVCAGHYYRVNMRRECKKEITGL